jgi:hypothetical protein
LQLRSPLSGVASVRVRCALRPGGSIRSRKGEGYGHKGGLVPKSFDMARNPRDSLRLLRPTKLRIRLYWWESGSRGFRVSLLRRESLYPAQLSGLVVSLGRY